MNTTRTQNEKLAQVYAYLAANPRATKLQTSEALGWHHVSEWEFSVLESRNLIRRVELRAGEQIDGRFATVASGVR